MNFHGNSYESAREWNFRRAAWDRWNIYREDGKFSMRGFCRMLWENVGLGFKVGGVVVAVGGVWWKLSRMALVYYDDGVKEMFEEDERLLRESNVNIKSDAHLAREGRTGFTDEEAPSSVDLYMPEEMHHRPAIERYVPKSFRD